MNGSCYFAAQSHWVKLFFSANFSSKSPDAVRRFIAAVENAQTLNFVLQDLEMNKNFVENLFFKMRLVQ